MQSKLAIVAEYLASLPEDRRAAISAVREVILANLGEGYEEGMSYGMIGYSVPHSVYPPGYHCDPKLPLPFFLEGAFRPAEKQKKPIGKTAVKSAAKKTAKKVASTR